MKHFSIVFILLIYCLIAQTQIKNKDDISIFSDFEQLGIQKEDFINQFGPPTAKDMAYDDHKNKIETLHYIEFLNVGLIDEGKIILLTKFTFRNNELVEQKSETPSFPWEKEMLEKIYQEIRFIR